MLFQECARASRPCVCSSCCNSRIAQVLVRMPHADIWEQRSLQSHELACVRHKRSEIAGEKRLFRLVPEPLRRVSRLSWRMVGLGVCATFKSLLLYTIRRCDHKVFCSTPGLLALLRVLFSYFLAAKTGISLYLPFGDGLGPFF
jgi:hypothetical protein